MSVVTCYERTLCKIVKRDTFEVLRATLSCRNFKVVFRLSSTRNYILYQNEHLSLLGFLFFRQQTDDKGKNDSIKIVSRGSIPPASGKGSSRAAKMRAMARGEDTASSLKQEQQVRLYDCFLPC